MKAILNIIGVVLASVGVIWILQGVNILPGSFMTGDPTWAVIGAVCVVIGAGLLVYVNRRGKG